MMMPQNVPSILYHYTSSSGLVGMYNTQEIWLSDIRFLNDSKEYKYACEILSRCISEYVGTRRQQWIDRGCDQKQFDGFVNNLSKKATYEEVYKKVCHIFRRGNPFVFSMTEKRDSLNQWRSYGNGEYCIGFDVERLTKVFGLKPINVKYLKECENGDDELKEIIKRFFEGSLRGIGPGDRINPEIYHDGIDNLIPTLLSSDFFVKHKHHSFHEEEEWRLVYHLDDRYDKEKELYFKPNGRYIKPYIKVGAHKECFELWRSVKEILCGPGLDHELCKSSLSMLKPRAMHDSPLISFSTIPYRAD